MSHTKEPWDIGNLNRGDTFLLHRPDYARAAQCVNAMAGVKNPAAIKMVIEVARTILFLNNPGHACSHGDPTSSYTCLVCQIKEALSAIDKEPAI